MNDARKECKKKKWKREGRKLEKEKKKKRKKKKKKKKGKRRRGEKNIGEAYHCTAKGSYPLLHLGSRGCLQQELFLGGVELWGNNKAGQKRGENISMSVMVLHFIF